MFLLKLIPRKALFLFFILPLVVCPLSGQTLQNKKVLTPDHYHLWNTIQIDKVSKSLKWISWNASYLNDRDTLFVKNLLNGRVLSFPSGSNSTFVEDDFFICQTDKNLRLLNLKSYKTQVYSNITRYVYSSPEHCLILLRKENEFSNTLLFKSLNNGTVKEIQNVSDFIISPTGKCIVYSISSSENVSSVHMYDLHLQSDLKVIESENGIGFSNFTWQNEGNAIAFFKRAYEKKIISLCFFNLKKNKITELTDNHIFNTLQIKSFHWDPFYKITISDNLERVFFSVKQNISENNSTPVPVEIWNGNDKWINPQNSKTGNFKDSPKIAVWEPESNICRQLSSDSLPKILLTGNFEYVLLYNPKDYEPQFDDEGPNDFYLMNLKTFEKTLLLKKQFDSRNSVIPSPGGRFIAYYKNNHWWIYDLTLKSHSNVTEKMGTSFTKKTRLSAETLTGSPGWSKDDKDFLIYDSYDVWTVKPDGSSFKKITLGAENKIVFRIAENSASKSLNYQYDKAKNQIYDLQESLIFKSHGEDEKTGYFQWFPNGTIKKIIYEDSLNEYLIYNAKEKKYIFLEQRFDMPPSIQLIDGNKKKTTIYASNKQHKKFFTGYSQLVYFQNSKKQNIKSVLIYPADYSPAKKYPMVVNIYEIQSMNLHQYYNPTLFNEGGFNPAVLSSEGYFVFMPDILLEEGNPGISAADCVTSATQKIIDLGLVNPAAIGLMGHSFGGYEASFIASQTNLFATVIPSGAITDLKRFYFTVNQRSGKPEWWRFQNLQWNMKKSPFEAPELYQSNSPINYVEKITVPILLWSGKEDAQVDVKQSIEFYLALRRLGKKNIMLLYPNENHAFSSYPAQKDITARILQWFDYFLKSKQGSEYQWIINGIQ